MFITTIEGVSPILDNIYFQCISNLFIGAVLLLVFVAVILEKGKISFLVNILVGILLFGYFITVIYGFFYLHIQDFASYTGQKSFVYYVVFLIWLIHWIKPCNRLIRKIAPVLPIFVFLLIIDYVYIHSLYNSLLDFEKQEKSEGKEKTHLPNRFIAKYDTTNQETFTQEKLDEDLLFFQTRLAREDDSTKAENCQLIIQRIEDKRSRLEKAKKDEIVRYSVRETIFFVPYMHLRDEYESKFQIFNRYISAIYIRSQNIDIWGFPNE